MASKRLETVGRFETGENPLATLAVADPDLAAEIKTTLAAAEFDLFSPEVRSLVEASLTAMSQEISFGRAVARGGGELLAGGDAGKLEAYGLLVREAGGKGPTLGRIMATYLVPVLKHGDQTILDQFTATVDVMCQKGTYTLKDPLEVMGLLLSEEESEAASQYLGLLCDAFSQKITYNQCQHFAIELPRTVRRMDPGNRPWQIRQMRRVVRGDVELTGAVIAGLSRGVQVLKRPALERFVSPG